MQLIHKDQRLWNVGIWYDERITVGESFSEEIDKAIRYANGFVLLATNALLELPNYVYDTEYQTAISIKSLKNKIIAVHLEGYKGDEKWDKDLFLHLYDTLSYVYSDDNIVEIRERLYRILTPPTMNDAATFYLIGLGYQNSISVETNSSIAIELLKRSAESGYRSAMERLIDTYRKGIGVGRNYEKSIIWQKELIKAAQPNQLSEEYCKLAGLYSEKHDWDEAIKYRQIAIELLTKDDSEKKIEIFAEIICDALNENNEVGYKTALITCCRSLSLLLTMVENGYEKDKLSSLHLILSQVIRILFMCPNSKRFQEQIKEITRQVYLMKATLLKYPELGIRESLCDSAFHGYFANQSMSFFIEAGITEKTESKIDYDTSFEYTTPAMLAEELTYIVLNLEIRFMEEDFQRNYTQVIRTLFLSIDFYLKQKLFAFARRNIQLTEKILDKAKTEWYVENLSLSFELEAKKCLLYYTMKDKDAVLEWNHLSKMIKEGKERHPELLLKGYEIVEKLICVIDSDVQTGKLLLAQEKMLNQIPENIYDRKEVDKMLLHNSVNLYIYMYKNNDSMCFSYYNIAIDLCKKLNESEKEEVFHALQSMYLVRLHYAAPKSIKECETIDTVIDALMKNLVAYLENSGDEVENEMKRVLYETDQYINWLTENHPEHVFITIGILASYLKDYLEPYVDSVMAENPNRFLPPTLRLEFSDYEIIKGLDLKFLQTFRTAFFNVHVFMITNLLDRNSKIEALCKVISIYKEAIQKLSQGYLFQVLNNEIIILEKYKEKLKGNL